VDIAGECNNSMMNLKDALRTALPRSPLALLTLDLATTIYEEMGVFPLAPASDFRDVIRRACGSPEALCRNESAIEAWETAFDLVSKELGKESGVNFRIWAEDIAFEGWTWSGSWYVYSYCMGNFMVTYYRTGTNVLENIKAGKSLLRLYSIMRHGGSIDRLLQPILRRRKVSVWDAKVMDIMEWKTDENGDPNRFLVQDTIHKYVSLNRFQIYWQFATTMMSDYELKLLEELVIQEAIDSRFDAPLPATELHRRLPI
jgi:hypothetical protein